MTITGNIKCTLPDLTVAAETVVQCTSDAANKVTAWDVGSTVANWGILLIAAMALIVSAKSRRDAQHEMEATLEQNHRATQAQLDASREAVRADLAERQNSRELDMAADFVASLDRLQMIATIHAGEPEKDEVKSQLVTDALSAASRFFLFVEDSRSIKEMLVIYVGLLDGFAPGDKLAFETCEFDRLTKVQTLLRSEIVTFQSEREISTVFGTVLALLKDGQMDVVDQMLKDTSSS